MIYVQEECCVVVHKKFVRQEDLTESKEDKTLECVGHRGSLACALIGSVMLIIYHKTHAALPGPKATFEEKRNMKNKEADSLSINLNINPYHLFILSHLLML